MVHATARLFETALLPALLATVRHLAPGARPASVHRHQRRRRRALRLASMGIDNGPRVIHGVKVSAAR